MKYWTIVEPGDCVEFTYTTLSEKQILKRYWDHWYSKMCEKFGKEYVDANYDSDDCIADWVAENWAWKTGED